MHDGGYFYIFILIVFRYSCMCYNLFLIWVDTKSKQKTMTINMAFFYPAWFISSGKCVDLHRKFFNLVRNIQTLLALVFGGWRFWSNKTIRKLRRNTGGPRILWKHLFFEFCSRIFLNLQPPLILELNFLHRSCLI